MTEEETEDEWNPEPAQLREGETRDISSHAQRNIEQLRMAEEEGDIDEEAFEEAKERIIEEDG